MDSLIHSDNTWALMSVMMAAVAASIYLEQRYRWASRVTGAVIAIVIALILVNTGVIPSSAPLYDDVVWGYIVPAAIPLLLFQTNIRKIWRETGQLLAIFIIGSFGTIAGAVIGCALLQNSIEGLPKVAAMMTGSYIGGSVNFAALADAFKVSGTLLSSAIVADNLNMAIYFLILLGVAGNAFVRRFYEHPLIDEVEEKGVSEEGKTLAAAYWGRKDVSLRDIAMCLTYTVIVVTVSKAIGGVFVTLVPPDGGWLAKMCSAFLGSQYVWLTVLSVGFASFFEKQASSMHGAQEIGTLFIYMFFFIIGVPASIMEILMNAPLLLVFCLIMVAVNMLFCLVGGKILNFPLEDILIASNANIGGPTTAAGMAISQGWTRLVGPAMLVGTFGYAIGTYIGIIVGSMLGA
ncbi:hypothetical protein AXF19_05770 [Selenomonas sp. oral taxon 126]|uniref:DUF819 family protein n=1 Tax=Selenomonas sp. oral taxon 126 TaxID=712528 RepID=UPI0008079739|nr:DUF819 family protein [Selenomonas sp. oral taxon 126]ANR70532.1 hypothetical protein AXF19_05770 [Selenomonas sp. oral taxon 126]